MARKRKTLPADFGEMIKKGDISQWKEVFSKCDINACGGYRKGTALSFPGISAEFIQWLTDQGADVNALDSFGMPPIYAQAQEEEENVKLLLELGADIEAHGKNKTTPLTAAADNHYVKAVRNLVKYGADINSKEGWQKKTPLECALVTCNNTDIPNTAEISDILLEAGAKVTPEMSEQVRRIGETFEFYRDDFNEEYLEETEKALFHLYKLFQVEPVPRKTAYDNASPITVKTAKWQDQHQELWNLLVPGSGHAKTVQGEVIRITGKLTRELLDNGGINWNKDYKKLPNALAGYFSLGNSLEKPLHKEAAALSGRISSKSGKEDLYRLSQLAVMWVLKNPHPIPLETPDYKR